jgi:hypothetical protein
MHAWCQSTVVALNLIVIAQLMVPSFRSQVAPKIPARLIRPYYAVATGHRRWDVSLSCAGCTLTAPGSASTSCPTQTYNFGQPTQRAFQTFGSGGPRALQLGAKITF